VLSMYTFIEPLLTKSQVSTYIDPSFTSSLSTIRDDAYVNIIFQVDASSNVAASCRQYSFCLPIFQFDVDIMDAMYTPEYPCT